MATVSVVLISGGIVALSLAALSAAALYADSVDRRIGRAQRALDAIACGDSASLVRAKDAFAAGRVRFDEFGCEIDL